MPIKKSTKKSLRQNPRRRAKNILYKSKIKDTIKVAKVLVSKKQNDEAKKLLPKIYKAIDKATKVGVIKKNTANRKKSEITKSINK
ncbi:MAG: 30S ribosomal protein S20 [Patescibacteria group bacterium]|nr:30S ribosomal protein S20 [Patescibacteria group bacterium]